MSEPFYSVVPILLFIFSDTKTSIALASLVKSTQINFLRIPVLFQLLLMKVQKSNNHVAEKRPDKIISKYKTFLRTYIGMILTTSKTMNDIWVEIQIQ